jgi:hypothetical protein
MKAPFLPASRKSVIDTQALETNTMQDACESELHRPNRPDLGGEFHKEAAALMENQ